MTFNDIDFTMFTHFLYEHMIICTSLTSNTIKDENWVQKRLKYVQIEMPLGLTFFVKFNTIPISDMKYIILTSIM